MVEKTNNESSQTAKSDLEPAPEYGVGDVVTLTSSLDPDARFLLTTPIKDTPEGLMTGGIPIDEAGNGLGLDGSIMIEDIKEKVGTSKSVDEIAAIYVDMFAVKYGDTIPRKEVIAMLERQIGQEISID